MVLHELVAAQVCTLCLQLASQGAELTQLVCRHLRLTCRRIFGCLMGSSVRQDLMRYSVRQWWTEMVSTSFCFLSMQCLYFYESASYPLFLALILS